MNLPSATYRLQLRDGMDFDRAAGLVPYLRDLGVGHLYLSPIFTAVQGSTHGYDVTDPNAIDPVLGGRDGFERLAAACRAAGLGIVLDIVPNHTAFSVETPWLRDVLRHGTASRYHGHFDLFADLPDLGPRLRLPWLDAPFEDKLAAGAVSVDADAEGPVLVAGPRVPLAGDVPQAAWDGDTDALRALHDAQPWRLTHWRTEAAAITHRRFFTVTGLIGMRVEDRTVFDDMHVLTFELVDAGLVQGLRVDHVDGLADPAGYLRRLRDRLPDTPIWIEKILTGDEAVEPDWPVQGTTGYVAARAFARALTDGAGVAALTERLAARGAPTAFPPALSAAKAQILAQELPAEVEQLTDLFARAVPGSEWGRPALRAALLAFVGAFPRYRSYATGSEIRPADERLIRETAARAADARPGGQPGALPLLADTLCDPAGAKLRLRLQQVTGAAIAKAQEDTAFYRIVPYLAANEVGAEPDHPYLDGQAFHDWMAHRAAAMPHGLTLTSSHDTKRAEDARMRLVALSHHPEAFDALLAIVPDDVPPAWRWYLAQCAFAGAPAGDLPDRLAAHAEKAAREAKQDTFWTAPDAAFETMLREASEHAARALDPLPDALVPVAARAARLSLAQAALKLTAPGIPDIYQGTEVGSYLLTDPDNRRPVDFDRLARGLDDPAILPTADATKLDLTATLLRLRRDRPMPFLQGGYAPLDAPAGAIRFRRGPAGEGVAVTVSIRGDDLDAGGAIWPPAALGPQPVAVDPA